MAETITSDPLERLIAQIRGWAKEHCVRILEGFVEQDGDHLVVLYNEEAESSLDNLLAAALDLETAVLVLNITRLSREEWEASLQQYANVEDPSEQQRADLRIVRKLEGAIGWVAAVEMRILTKQPQLLLKYDRFAEWFDLIYASEEDRGDENFEDADESVNEELLEEFGRTVASDRGYQNSRNDIQRNAAVTRLLGKNARLKEVERWQILQSASEIYQAEFRASHEALLVEEANRLRKEGLKKSDIAVRLGVSFNRVRDLLS